MADLVAWALTDLASVKESLGIASSNTASDNLIKRKINQATLAIENYCGRRFLETTYTNEEYDASNTDELILKQRPISNVSLGIRDTSLNDEDWNTVDSDLYFTDTAGTSGVLNLNFNALGRWNRYRVTYTAGYATIPEDLAEACVVLACYYYNNADGSNVGLSEKREGQRSIKYANSSASASLNFRGIMEQLGIDQIIDSYANFSL